MPTTAATSEEIVGWRRHIHRNPELSFQEANTSAYVAGLLESFGIEVQHPTETSVLGILKGDGGPGRTVALRADMDALPVSEETGAPFSSAVEGVMHACGHDAHTAMLLGAAKTLAGIRGQFAGTVKFVFQHAEERNPGGAIGIVETGLLSDVEGIFALHVMNQKLGTLSVHKGAASTIAGGCFLTIKGRGSHGSMPQDGIDPVLTGAQIVTALNTITARSTVPGRLNIVNVGRFQSGDAPNVVPDTASLGISLRSADDDDYGLLVQRVTDTVHGICTANGAAAEFEWVPTYPAVQNDSHLAELAYAAAGKVIGEDAYWGPGTSASEDFSNYTKVMPGCFLLLGAGDASNGVPYMNHHPKFNIVEDCLPIGARLEVQIALDFLAE